METDDQSNEFGLAFSESRRKLTWISREDGITNSPGSIYCPSMTQVDGRQATFRVLDSPARGIYNKPESPARRGESVRRIRTPAMDLKVAEASSNLFTSRRLRSINPLPRSGSEQEDSEVIKSDHKVVKEGSAIHKIITGRAAREQKITPEKKVQFVTAESPNGSDSEKMVVSYLAEETDRIIKERKASKNRPISILPAQLETTDHERSSPGELRSSYGGRGPPSNSSRQVQKADTYKTHRSHSFVDPEIHDRNMETILANRAGSPKPQGSPFLTVQSDSSAIGEGIGPTRTISATMENYLENRRKGSNTGTRIIVATKLPSPAEIPSNLPTLRLPNEPENPSSSSKIGIGIGRYDHFNAPRVALSPLNGNEDVTHSSLLSVNAPRVALSPLNGNEDVTHSTLQSDSKEEHKTGLGEDWARRIRTNFNESVQMQRKTESSNRLQYWAEYVGNGEMVFAEGTRNSALQGNKDQTFATSGEVTGTDVSHSLNGFAREYSSLGRREIDGNHVRNTGSRGHSQRFGDTGRSQRFGDTGSRGQSQRFGDTGSRGQSQRFGDTGSRGQSQRFGERERSLFSEKMLGVGYEDIISNSSRRSQSCRRESVIHSLPHSTEEENPALPFGKTAAVSLLKRGSPRFLANIPSPVSRSCETLQERPSILAHSISDKSQVLYRNSPDLTKIIHNNIDLLLVDSRRSDVKKPSTRTERAKVVHTSSRSFDQDIYNKLVGQTRKDSKTGHTVTSSTSVSQNCSKNSPRIKPQPSSPGANFQRWLASQFKLGSRSKTSSASKDNELKEEQKSRRKSPWRTRSGEIFHVITRRKGNVNRPAAAPLLDIQGLQNLRQSTFGNGTQSPMIGPEWHRRMMQMEAAGGGSMTPAHRNGYALPTIASMSPAHSKGMHTLISAKHRT